TDPEMSSTRKGTEWSFGMQLHVGTDQRGFAHSAVVTTAKVHDSVMLEQLVHGDEKRLYGDRAYINGWKQQQYEARGVSWNIQRRGQRNVRYRGLAKNEAQCFTLLALANLYLVRKELPV